MQVIPITDIDVRPRQRQAIDQRELTKLKDSIRSVGLLHAPTVWLDRSTGRWVLVAGETRLRAIRDLSAEGVAFMHDGILIAPPNIPVNIFAEVFSAIDRISAELEENTHRKDLTWQEQTTALALIHKLRQEANPTQSYTATAREIIASQPAAAGNVTHPTAMRQKIQDAIIVSEHLGDGKIAN